MERSLSLITIESYLQEINFKERVARYEEHQNKARLVALTMITTAFINPTASLLFIPELGRQLSLRKASH
jgi:hypothetical protein